MNIARLRQSIERTLPGGVAAIDILDANGNVVVSAASGAAVQESAEVSALISGLIGTMLGAFAGYFGGALDKITSEVINIFLMIPTFFLVLIIVSIFGSNMFNVMLVIGLTSWPSNARMMRVQAMSLKERTYIKGAVVMGESRLRILFKYIIPNGLFPVIANTTMGVAKAILTEASLSFLGLGDPNIVSWARWCMTARPSCRPAGGSPLCPACPL